MKRFLMLGLLVLPVPVLAADLAPSVNPIMPTLAPVPPSYSWTGLTVGANIGGGFGNDRSGVIGGGELGYNYQVGPSIVFGLAADYDWSNLNSGSVPVDLPWMATGRGRVGYLLTRNLLVYGTGGVAFANADIAGQVFSRTGYAAGAGLEYAFVPGWTAKLEYLHYNLGTVTVADPPEHHHVTTFTDTLSGDRLQTGISYRF